MEMVTEFQRGSSSEAPGLSREPLQPGDFETSVELVETIFHTCVLLGERDQWYFR